MEPTTRIIDMTAGELADLIAVEVRRNMPKPQVKLADKAADGPLYGIKGIATALHCCERKAQRLKQEGKLEGGYMQVGRGIIVPDPDKLREIAVRSEKKHGRSRIKSITV